MIGEPEYIVNENVNWSDLLNEKLNFTHIIKKNLDKINWFSLSQNPNAINILENNLNKINWLMLSQNPNAIHLLTKLNYDLMKNNMIKFNEELVAKVFHPNRLLKICKDYNVDFIDLVDIF